MRIYFITSQLKARNICNARYIMILHQRKGSILNIWYYSFIYFVSSSTMDYLCWLKSEMVLFKKKKQLICILVYYLRLRGTEQRCVQTGLLLTNTPNRGKQCSARFITDKGFLQPSSFPRIETTRQGDCIKGKSRPWAFWVPSMHFIYNSSCFYRNIFIMIISASPHTYLVAHYALLLTEYAF